MRKNRIGASFGTLRRLAAAAQAIVVLGLPFVSIGGESALRLDVPAGRLHAFGASFAIDEAFVVLAATLLVTAAFLLVTLLFGRVWCGWGCPQTILADAFNDRPLEPAHGAPLRLYSPIKLGYKMTKYLARVTFTADRPGGYWEDKGYPWFAGL